MSNENKNGVPKRRPLPYVAGQSPKVVGRSATPLKAGRSPAIHDRNLGGRGFPKDEEWAANGYMEESLGENAATPVKTFLDSNITPRSSSRKARAGNASPACNGTPKWTSTASNETPSKIDTTAVGLTRISDGAGSRISSSGRKSKTGSFTSNGPASSIPSDIDPVQRTGSAPRISSPENPKFFHASDIRPVLSRPNSELSALNSAGFEESQNISGNVTRDEQRAKFFYANDSTTLKSPPLGLTNGNVQSRPQLHTIYSSNLAGSPPRPTSPLKEEMLSQKAPLVKPSPRRHTRLVSNGGNEIKLPETVSTGKSGVSRRSSLNSPRPPQGSTHKRSPSVPTEGQTRARRASIGVSGGSPVERARAPSITGANGALPHSINPLTITNELPQRQVPSQPPSPTRQPIRGQSKIDQMNELAANARRERKVLDLEISNSSLLAINRTLEREMRKQNAELRRFRRLSRSGRMSIAPPSRSASGRMFVFPQKDIDVDSDDLVSSSDDEGDAIDLLSDKSSASPSSHPSSPSARTARARFQDPKRIELDLAAHRVLLQDSQKLNISIRRCLAHCESLISSGKKALEYQAHVPDQANQGARVLPPDELDDDFIEQGQGLLSPGICHESLNPWERSPESMNILDDGAKTPDYSQWGSPTSKQTSHANTTDASSRPTSIVDHVGSINKVDHGLTHLSNDNPSDLRHDARRGRKTASLDGLDEDNATLSMGEVNDVSHAISEDNKAQLSPSKIIGRMSRNTSPERNGKNSSAEIQPDQPGYRGSMQSLGHYLQAFSIFGAPQSA